MASRKGILKKALTFARIGVNAEATLQSLPGRSRNALVIAIRKIIATAEGMMAFGPCHNRLGALLTVPKMVMRRVDRDRDRQHQLVVPH